VHLWQYDILDPLFLVLVLITMLPAVDRQIRKYRCVGVCICECAFQLEMDIFMVKLDASNWPLPSAGVFFFSGETEASSSPSTTLHCHTRTTEVGTVRVGVGICLCVCVHEACSNPG